MKPLIDLGLILGPVLGLTVALAACSGAPLRDPAPLLFDDAAYGPAPAALQDLDVFAISPEMKAFLVADVSRQVRAHGYNRGLYEAMREKLRIDYDAGVTRTAAQTFDVRAGNCLSLVILTAALAGDLDIPVRFQFVRSERSWTRYDGMVFLNGHVNIALDPRSDAIGGKNFVPPLVIDFLPSAELGRQQITEIPRQRVLAMYMNNRAAETLVGGDVDAAYWWARAAVREDRAFVSAYNTLGVIHRRHGEPALAERSFRMALAQEPDNAELLSNLVELLAQQGRTQDAAPLREKLARIEPIRPFQLLDAGNVALAAGDPLRAMDLYRQELQQLPYSAEVHYAMAIASARLANAPDAQRYLAQAAELSTTLRDRDIYASKLQKLRAAQLN